MAKKNISQSQKNTTSESTGAPDQGSTRTNRKRNIIIAVIVAFVILAVAGVAIYVDQVAPFRVTVISVNDASIRMRTFLRRTYLGGEEPMSMLQTLSNEEIIRQVAPAPPYNIQVTEDLIDEALRASAQGDGEPLSDNDYKAWYRDQVNESRMSDREFRDFVEVRLIMQQLNAYLAERVPTVSEQVRLNMILVDGLDTARVVKSRIEAGEDFASVAREVSIDSQLREDGGDLGWQARDSLTTNISRIAFDELAVNEVSDPLNIEEEIFALLMVSERAAAREMNDETRRRVQSSALEMWLREEQKNHDIEFHGFSGPYDSVTDAWVRWQLQRMKR